MLDEKHYLNKVLTEIAFHTRKYGIMGYCIQAIQEKNHIATLLVRFFWASRMGVTYLGTILAWYTEGGSGVTGVIYLWMYPVRLDFGLYWSEV